MPRPSDPQRDQPAGETPSAWPAWARLHLWQIQPVRDVALILLVLWLIDLGYTLRLVTVPMLLALLLAYLFEPLVSYLTRKRGIARTAAVGGLLAGTVAIVVLPVALGLILGAAQIVAFISEQWPNALRVAAYVQAYAPEAEAPAPESAPGSAPGSTTDSDNDTQASPDSPSIGPTIPAPGTPQPEPGAPTIGAPSASDGPSTQGAVDPDSRPADPADRASAERAFKGLTSPAWRDIARYLARNSTRPEVVQAADWVRDNAGTIGRATLRQGADAIGAVTKAFTSLGLLAFSAFLTAFFFFFFSMNFASVIEFGSRMIPRAYRPRALDLVGKMDRVIAGFIRGRLTICAVMAVLFTLLYWLIGVPAPLVVGIVVGALSVVPYLASVGIPASILLLWLDPPGGFRSEWWWIIGAPTAVYYLVQMADDYVLTPRIQGKSTDMAMPAIVFASIAGGILGGFYGLLLAIPVAACLKILWKEVLLPRLRAWTDGRASDPLPVEGAPSPAKNPPQNDA